MRLTFGLPSHCFDVLFRCVFLVFDPRLMQSDNPPSWAGSRKAFCTVPLYRGVCVCVGLEALWYDQPPVYNRIMSAGRFSVLPGSGKAAERVVTGKHLEMETHYLRPHSSSVHRESVLKIKSYNWLGLVEWRDLCGCWWPPFPPAASPDTLHGLSPPPAGSYSWDVALPAEETVNVNTREWPHSCVRLMFKVICQFLSYFWTWLHTAAHFTSPCWQVLNHNWFLVRPEGPAGSGRPARCPRESNMRKCSKFTHLEKQQPQGQRQSDTFISFKKTSNFFWKVFFSWRKN